MNGTLTIKAKDAAPITTAPEAAEGWTEDGTSHSLLKTAGASDGGTFYYKVNDDSWSADVPEATAAGEYKIRYYIKGEGIYKDNGSESAPLGPLTVTVFEKGAPKLTTQPEGASGLEANGSMQDLLKTAGIADGGTVMYSVNGGAAAAVDDPRTWCSYEEAAEALQDRPGKYRGLAFFFTEEDPFFVIDLDSCVRDMRISDEARAMIERFRTYAELSQSRRGIHIIGQGVKHTERCRKDGVEIYDRRRFLAITGDRVSQTAGVEDCQGELDELTAELWPLKPAPKPAPQSRIGGQLPEAEEILKRMFAGKNGPILEDLYRRGV